jgi:hypothetical protein
MSWEFIVPAVIQNGFAKCSFGTLSEVSAEEDEEMSWCNCNDVWMSQ